MATTPSVAQNWRPNLEGKIHPDAVQAIQRVYEAVKDHDQAITTLGTNMTAAAAKTSSTAAATGALTTATAASVTAAATTAAVKQTTAMIASTFGNVNQQTTAYAVQNTDYGSLVTFNSTTATTATLNQAVNQNYLGAIQNNGSATLTVQPQQGLLNNAASLDLAAGTGAWFFYDGMNWWAVTSPPSAAPAVVSVNGIVGAVTIAGTQNISVATEGNSVIIQYLSDRLQTAVNILCGGASSGVFTATLSVSPYGATPTQARVLASVAPENAATVFGGWLDAWFSAAGVVTARVNIPAGTGNTYTNVDVNLTIFDDAIS